MTTTFRRAPNATQTLLQIVDPHVHRVAINVQGEARRRVGVRGNPRTYPGGRGLPTGVQRGDQLRPSIHVVIVGSGHRKVGSDNRIALLHHQGTGPHQILPRKPGGLLAFYWTAAGGVVFFRRVNHPGTKPNPYLVDGAIAVGLTVTDRLVGRV